MRITPGVVFGFQYSLPFVSVAATSGLPGAFLSNTKIGEFETSYTNSTTWVDKIVKDVFLFPIAMKGRLYIVFPMVYVQCGVWSENLASFAHIRSIADLYVLRSGAEVNLGNLFTSGEAATNQTTEQGAAWGETPVWKIVQVEAGDIVFVRLRIQLKTDNASYKAYGKLYFNVGTVGQQTLMPVNAVLRVGV